MARIPYRTCLICGSRNFAENRTNTRRFYCDNDCTRKSKNALDFLRRMKKHFQNPIKMAKWEGMI